MLCAQLGRLAWAEASSTDAAIRSNGEKTRASASAAWCGDMISCACLMDVVLSFNVKVTGAQAVTQPQLGRTCFSLKEL